MSESTQDLTLAQRGRRVVAAASIGTLFEYYDNSLYGLATAIVFGAAFFPNESQSAAAIAAFGAYAVAYAARPVGGIIFGHIGDRLGRKRALQLTFTIMGVATLLVGFLPAYSTIGVLAPVILIVLRLIQGIAVGGETGGAWVTLVETAPPNRRGLFGAFVQVGAGVGAVLSSVVFLALTAIMDDRSFVAWGWRIAFLLAGLLVPIGIYLRRQSGETPEFTAVRKNDARADVPIVTVLREQWRMVLVVAGVSGAYLTAVLLASYYTPSFLKATPAATTTYATVIPLLFLVLHALLIAPAGWLGDVIGRRKVFLIGLVLLLAYAYPYFLMLSSGVTALVALASLLMAFPGALLAGNLGTLITEVFVGNVRYTGVSVGYQLGSILGGLSPLIAASVFAVSGKSWWALSSYLAVTTVIGLSCLAAFPSRSRIGQLEAPTAPAQSPENAGSAPVRSCG